MLLGICLLFLFLAFHSLFITRFLIYFLSFSTVKNICEKYISAEMFSDCFDSVRFYGLGEKFLSVFNHTSDGKRGKRCPSAANLFFNNYIRLRNFEGNIGAFEFSRGVSLSKGTILKE